ncbi:MAG: hypothetical protein ACRDTM_02940 [Micromonosporaceae bacterium]
MGRMRVDLRSARDVLCVAGGTGLAPLKAIAEELSRGNRIRTDRPRHVHLFFGPSCTTFRRSSSSPGGTRG